MSKFAKMVYGIDISEEAVNYAINNYSADNIEFKVSSIEKLPFKDSEFDVIVSFETVEHVDFEVQKKFLDEIKRTLKKDGVLIISTPNKEVYSDIVDYHNEYHKHEFTKKEFLDFLNTKYKYVEIYDQKFDIFSEVTSSKSEKFRKLSFNADKNDVHEKYLIAVCSDVKLKNGEFDLSSFMKLKDEIMEESFLFYEENENYNDNLKKKQQIHIDNNKFSVRFDLSDIPQNMKNKKLRWDPVEGKICFCRIDNIKTDGILKNNYPFNAREYYGNKFIFLTSDPIFIIEGDFSKSTYIEIEGEIIFPNSYEISVMIDRMYSTFIDSK